MPILAAKSILKVQISNALKMGMASNPGLFSLLFTSALASAVPMGLFPMGVILIPLPPIGFSACQNMVKSSMGMGVAANSQTTSMLMATGISLLVPIVPPAGLSLLQSTIKNSLDMGMASNPDLFAEILSTAIPMYYMSGGVI